MYGIVHRFIVAAALLLGVTSAVAQSKYPERPVTIVVAFAPGGTNDIVGRLFADELTKRTGRQFLVENLPGANGSIGATSVATAPANGYRLLMGSQGMLIQNPHMFKDVKYSLDDFTPVAKLATLDFLVVVRPALKIDSVQKLIQHAKANPDAINFGSPGIGNTAHLAGELFQLKTGARFTHIPYQGGAPAVAAFLAGDIDVLFNTTSEVLPHIKSGGALPLATMSGERNPLVPNAPTLAEAGAGDTQFSADLALFAPDGTPKDVVDYLNKQVSEIVADERVSKRLLDLGLRASAASPEQISAQFAADGPKLIELVDLVNAQKK